MKKITFSFFVFLLCITNVFADNIVIQLAAFNRAVDQELYFQGISDVEMMRDHNNFYIYYINTESDNADTILDNYKEMGYNAYVIDLNNILNCLIACRSPRAATPTYSPPPQPEVTYDSPLPEPEGYAMTTVEDFEKARVVIMDDPNHLVKLEGNQQMIRKVQCYLNLRGVANCRIDASEYWQNIKTGDPATLWLFGDEKVIDIESEFRRIVNERKQKMQTSHGTIYTRIEH